MKSMKVKKKWLINYNYYKYNYKLNNIEQIIRKK